MNSIVEKVILENLLYNENYTRKVVPFLKDEYFQVKEDKVIYKTISEFVSKYNKLPTKEALLVDLSNNKNLTQQEYDSMVAKINDFSTSEQDEQWLVNETEKFCKDKAIYNAILESIHIIDGKS
ncbi:MAG: DNA primase, partial [Micrococcales bacterium]|nr:DNA primase [Micrococcales bacterium]